MDTAEPEPQWQQRLPYSAGGVNGGLHSRASVTFRGGLRPTATRRRTSPRLRPTRWFTQLLLALLLVTFGSCERPIGDRIGNLQPDLDEEDHRERAPDAAPEASGLADLESKPKDQAENAVGTNASDGEGNNATDEEGDEDDETTVDEEEAEPEDLGKARDAKSFASSILGRMARYSNKVAKFLLGNEDRNERDPNGASGKDAAHQSVSVDAEGQTIPRKKGSGDYLKEGGVRVISWSTRHYITNPFATLLPGYGKDYMILNQGFEKTFGETEPKDCWYCRRIRHKVITEIFSDFMFEDLCKHVTNDVGSGVVENILKPVWEQGFAGGKGLRDRTVIEFLRDPVIMESGIIKDADLQTSLLLDGDGNLLSRPSLITTRKDKLKSMRRWWKRWQKFMFIEVNKFVSQKVEASNLPNMVGDLLQAFQGRVQSYTTSTMFQRIHAPWTYAPIKDLQDAWAEKTPDKWKERSYGGLVTMVLFLAVYDAILLDVAFTIEKAEGVEFDKLREELSEDYVLNKQSNMLSILADVYSNVNVMLLQDMNQAFFSAFSQGRLGTQFQLFGASNAMHDFVPRTMVALSVSYFETARVQDKAPEIVDKLRRKYMEKQEQLDWSYAPKFSRGMLSAVLVNDSTDEEYLFVSLKVPDVRQGGEALTTFIVETIDEYRMEFQKDPPHLFLGVNKGLSIRAPEDEGTEKSRAEEFAKALKKKHLSSCWRDKPSHTSYTHLSYMQPALGFARDIEDQEQIWKRRQGVTQDHIIYDSRCWSKSRLWKDNTGITIYDKNVQYPTQFYPSANALVAISLNPKPCSLDHPNRRKVKVDAITINVVRLGTTVALGCAVIVWYFIFPMKTDQ